MRAMKLFKSHRPNPSSAEAPRPAGRSVPPGTAVAAGRTAPPAANGGKSPAPTAGTAAKPTELGGPSGPEPTRYGDWERKGICYDF